jgi:hypothetical protein
MGNTIFALRPAARHGAISARLRGRMGQVARRHASLHTSLTDLGSKPEAGTVNQTVHPSWAGKLVAINVQWVTAVEDCVRLMRLDDATYHMLVSCSPHGRP